MKATRPYPISVSRILLSFHHGTSELSSPELPAVPGSLPASALSSPAISISRMPAALSSRSADPCRGWPASPPSRPATWPVSTSATLSCLPSPSSNSPEMPSSEPLFVVLTDGFGGTMPTSLTLDPFPEARSFTRGSSCRDPILLMNGIPWEGRLSEASGSSPALGCSSLCSARRLKVSVSMKQEATKATRLKAPVSRHGNANGLAWNSCPSLHQGIP
mmetsp:Transcript_29085/g.81972  ORF Transcript_29085/g.81972 Transcript_29085/m.81972 type:complete len:218 (+) Transcript_29085:1380-2033(+)